MSIGKDALAALLKYHDDLYYNQDKPIISDYEYDALKNQYVELYGEYDYVPGEAQFSKFEHTELILSLDKVQISDTEKLRAEIDRLWPIVIEPKFDGLTIVAYPGQIFVTRGNGKIGENVTKNCMAIECLQNIDPSPDPIRMEVLMPISEFNAINERRAQEGLEPFKNPRNAAAGMLRNKDASKVEGLTAFIYDVVGNNRSTHTHMLYEFEQQDCDILTPYWVFSDIYGSKEAGIEAAIQFIQNFDRSKLDYEIDGLVIKSNKPNSLEHFGMTGHHPKNAIAVKFEAEGEWTTLKSVTWQVGKTGAITPVGEIEPVEILGSTISRVTLHNISIIRALNIRINGPVKVIKANDVIPRIIESRGGILRDDFPVIPPELCPVCGAVTEFREDILYCTGDSCEAQLEGKISLMSSRDALNIEGLSDATIKKMIQYYKDHDIELYLPLDFDLPLHFEYDDILALPGFAPVSAKKLYDNIQKAKDTELKRFIYAANIPLIGKSASEAMANHLLTLDALIEEVNNGFKSTAQLDDFGPKMIKSLNDYASDRFTLLWKAGIRPRSVEKKQKTLSSDQILTFVITGKFDISRSEITQMIKDSGHKVSGSVSKMTNILLASEGEESTAKYKRAQELGIKIINTLDELSKALNA